MSERFSAAEAARWCAGVWEPAPPARVAGVTNDTRSLRPGELYVALRGARCDGHAFVAEAFRRGACGALVERGFAGAGAPERPLLRCADPALALRALARGYRERVAPLVIGVTGSAGKTTVKELTARLVARARRAAATRGNWNNEIGLPLSLLEMAPDTQVGVFELGISHPGEMRPLCEILRPQWGIVSSLGRAHLEFFGSFERIAREKAELFAALPPDGLAVFRADMPGADILRRAAACETVTVALEQDADYSARRRKDGVWLAREARTGETAELRLALPGPHQAANALLAAAVARRLGVSWTEIREALAAYGGLPLRWEIVWADGVRYVNDAYNANPESMRAALNAFAEEPAAGRQWLVLGDMLELGAAAEAEHRQLGAFAARGAWAGLATVGALARGIADGAEAAGFDPRRIWRCADAAEAAAVLRRQTAAGDAVLLKASRGVRLEEVLQRLTEGKEERQP